jgi:hypothetical protein
MSLYSMFNMTKKGILANWKVLNKTLTRFYRDPGRVYSVDDWYDRIPFDAAFREDGKEWIKE